MLTKKYYDGFIVHDILDKHLEPKKMMEVLTAFAEVKGVDAVPVRHGKWIYGENESGHDGYYCSQCGEHVRWRYGEEDIDFIRSYNYCPNCGARMDEE